MPLVFLSPSTQEWNKYLTAGNEEYWMNKLADLMEPYLMSSGIDYVRNDPTKNVQGAIDDSNEGEFDVHLALHTNAGGGQYAGILRGVDIYYSPFSQFGQSLAVIIANNMKNIYPIPSKVNAVPTTSLAEVTRTRAVAVLCELGYHDNPEDEQWIITNLDRIAVNLVMSLCDYFGIPFVEAQPVRTGYVRTDGSNLNIRSFPSVNSAVKGKIPNGARVNIYGTVGNWYVVRYNGITGYAHSDYITVE